MMIIYNNILYAVNTIKNEWSIPIYQSFMEETPKTLNTKVVGAVAVMLGLLRVLLNPINGPARSWELSQNQW